MYSKFAEERIKEWRKKDREQTDFIREFAEKNKPTEVKIKIRTPGSNRKFPREKDKALRFKEPKFKGFRKKIFGNKTKRELNEEVRDFVGVPKFLMGR